MAKSDKRYWASFIFLLIRCDLCFQCKIIVATGNGNVSLTKTAFTIVTCVFKCGQKSSTVIPDVFFLHSELHHNTKQNTTLHSTLVG